MWGILQPFADAIKLFFKERRITLVGNSYLFALAPVIGMFLVLLLWTLCPLLEGISVGSVTVLVLFAVLRLNLYPLLVAGWASNSKYALVGALRGVAQTISYEIRLAVVVLRFLLLSFSITMRGWVGGLRATSAAIISLPIIRVWLISGVAETNRTPFDFAEGESELVSGFNIEYGAGGFALIFIAEYASILFLRFLTRAMLAGQPALGALRALGTVSLAFIWVWLRATLPRYRYDKLINLAWKGLLPLSLAALVLSTTLRII